MADGGSVVIEFVGGPDDGRRTDIPAHREDQVIQVTHVEGVPDNVKTIQAYQRVAISDDGTRVFSPV